jgi:hypothetical protein
LLEGLTNEEEDLNFWNKTKVILNWHNHYIYKKKLLLNTRMLKIIIKEKFEPQQGTLDQGATKMALQ